MLFDVEALDTWHQAAPIMPNVATTVTSHLACICRSKQPKEMKSQRNSKKGTRNTHLLEADSGSSSLSSEEDELFRYVHKVGHVEHRYQKLITTLSLGEMGGGGGGGGRGGEWRGEGGAKKKHPQQKQKKKKKKFKK